MEQNSEIELAWRCIENTGSHLFLTGKAGTGKTTFLRKLKEKSPKRMIVVAPTGIAAINAGGVTIHSFFQLSFAPYVPESTLNSAQYTYRFSKEKISIIRSMDLLVIDEISMVRADLLDAVDAVLRRYRDRYKPFGGVQLLMIGDLQQLAPVVKEGEWNILKKYYSTSFFFGSHAFRETECLTIQLRKVYRQKDDRFLDLLNRIRTNQIDRQVLTELNQRYIPDFQPDDEEGYIRLATHNYQVQRVNDQKLSMLPQQLFSFKATIEGNFPETAFPADVDLHLKKGAQIMFLKNDSSGERRYYNGKIGVVTAVNADSISVWGKGDSSDFVLEKEAWTNSKYTLNDDTKEITEEVEGTFRQYPIRLAWAITIHKSQGLTFDRAIIEANTSFAHGQVYVALSRCKTLEGMVLASPLSADSVINDESISEFIQTVESQYPDHNRLDDLQRRYYHELLCELFGFATIKRYFSQLLRLLDEFMYNLYPKTLEGYKSHFARFENEIEEVSVSFRNRYSELMRNPGYVHDPVLNERLTSGAKYFYEKTEDILSMLIRKTKIEPDNKELRKKFEEAFDTLSELIRIKSGTLAYTAQHGFEVGSYLKNKARIIVSVYPPAPTKRKADERMKRDGNKKKAAQGRSTESNKPQKPERAELSIEIEHPILYKTLVGWRYEESTRTGMPAYIVIRQKSLLEIVNTLPRTIGQLESISYFGKKKAEKYGRDIIRMVEDYIDRNGK